MRGHLTDTRRPFRPTLRGGGSEKGKPWNRWPLLFVVVADAVYSGKAGGLEALVGNRDWEGMGCTSEALVEAVDDLMPNAWEWVLDNLKPTKTLPWKNLHNRVYKMYYSGTSARGPKHDPRTRAAISKEHWHNRVPTGTPEGEELRKLHEQIERGQVRLLSNWLELLRRYG